MAVNREGLGDSHPAALGFTLRPFFWQTSWFRALAVLLISGVLVEVTRRRTRIRAERLNMRFQERVAERERHPFRIARYPGQAPGTPDF